MMRYLLDTNVCIRAIVSHNLREFHRVPGPKIEDWEGSGNAE